MKIHDDTLGGIADVQVASVSCSVDAAHVGPARRAAIPALLTMAFNAAVLVLAFTGPAAAIHCKSSPAPRLDWSDCNKSHLILRRADLEGAILLNTNFTLTDLRDANLKSANLEKAKLVRASLAGAMPRRQTSLGSKLTGPVSWGSLRMALPSPTPNCNAPTLAERG